MGGQTRLSGGWSAEQRATGQLLVRVVDTMFNVARFSRRLQKKNGTKEVVVARGWVCPPPVSSPRDL